MTRAAAEQTGQRVGSGQPGARPLSSRECWSRLRHYREGRLGYLSGRGLRHVVVPYAVVDNAVVVRVPAFNEATQYARGQRLTFDVSRRVRGVTDERVQVVGRGQVLEPEGVVVDALPAESWPADLPSRVVWLQVDHIDGEAAPVDHPTRSTGWPDA